MPYAISKMDGKYRVTSPHGVKSKGTTLKKAIKQRRLLNAIKHGMKPRMGMKERGMKPQMEMEEGGR